MLSFLSARTPTHAGAVELPSRVMPVFVFTSDCKNTATHPNLRGREAGRDTRTHTFCNPRSLWRPQTKKQAGIISSTYGSPDRYCPPSKRCFGISLCAYLSRPRLPSVAPSPHNRALQQCSQRHTRVEISVCGPLPLQ